MALRFIDSFDHYSTAQITRKWTSTGGSLALPPAIVAGEGSGNPATQALRLSRDPTGGTTTTRTIDAQGTWIVGWNARFTDLPSTGAGNVLLVSDVGASQVSLQVNVDGTLAVSRAGNTVLGTSTNSISAGQFYYIEFKATIHPSSGTFEVRVNGSTWISGTGQNTRATANSTANQITWQIGTSFPVPDGFPSRYFIDDVYICDGTGSRNNDFLGAMRVTALRPNGDGNSTQWTRSTGSTNWEAVDDTLVNDDTDYVFTTDADDVDLYTLTGLPAGVTTVHGIQTVIGARKDDAGTRQIARVLRSDGTDYDGTTVGIGDTYSFYSEIAETDPATDDAWTPAAVNSLEAGVKLVS